MVDSFFPGQGPCRDTVIAPVNFSDCKSDQTRDLEDPVPDPETLLFKKLKLVNQIKLIQYSEAFEAFVIPSLSSIRY